MVEKLPNDLFSAYAIDGKGNGLREIDPAAIAALCKLRPRIRAYLRYVIRDRDERDQAVSDLCNEVMAVVLDEDNEKVELWPQVLRVLRRIAREEWRRSREVQDDYVLDGLVADSEAENRRAYRLALWEWAETAMKHLTTQQRGALELHAMDGLSDHDIAALLGCAQGSVRVLRATAKKRLRDLVDRGVIPMPPDRDATHPHSGR